MSITDVYWKRQRVHETGAWERVETSIKDVNREKTSESTKRDVQKEAGPNMKRNGYGKRHEQTSKRSV